MVLQIAIAMLQDPFLFFVFLLLIELFGKGWVVLSPLHSCRLLEPSLCFKLLPTVVFKITTAGTLSFHQTRGKVCTTI